LLYVLLSSPNIFIVGEPGDTRDALAERAGLVQGRGVAAAAVPRATVERRACSPVSDRATHAYSIEKSGRPG
jgi:hypothetical protein